MPCIYHRPITLTLPPRQAYMIFLNVIVHTLAHYMNYAKFPLNTKNAFAAKDRKGDLLGSSSL